MLKDRLLTYGEAAELLNLSPNTLRVYVMEKKIPFLKIEKSVRFDRETLGNWANSKLVAAH